MIEAVDQELNPLKLLFHAMNGSDELSGKITDFFPAIVYVYDADSKRLKYINRKITEVLGYSYDDISNWNDDLTNIVYKEDLDLVKQELEKFYSLKDNESYSYNSRLNHKQGNWKYFRTMGTVLSRNDAGNAASMLFVAQDVTEEIEGDKKFRRIEELFNDTQDILKFGVWEWDVPENKISWSNGLYRLLGYDPLTEKETLDITPEFYLSHILEEDREKVKQDEEHRLNHHEYDNHYRVRDRNGRVKSVRERAKVIRNKKDELIRVIGSTMDVTEQLQLYHDLADYKAAKQENEDLLSYGTWEYDAVNDKYSWSDGMFRLYGYDPDIARKKVTISDELYKHHLDPADYEKSLLMRQTLLNKQNGEEHYSWEYQITTAGGDKRRLETFGKIIFDNKGDFTKMIGTTRDISRLHQYRQNLEEKIKDLNRSNKELEEFAYVASHDMNEPLRKITTFVERLESKHKNELGADGQLYLNRIVASVQNMRSLIDTLLEFSRTARNDHPFEMVNLNTVLNTAKVNLDWKMEETSAEIKSGELPVIEAVKQQMEQLFDNLLNNSLKFRHPDTAPQIHIFGERLNKKEADELHLSQEKSYYKFIFTDNGIGFEQEYSERIFLIFQRLHGKTEFPGSGIGLSICKKIVDHHNGIIYASSKPGDGSTFTVILPERQ
jgi:PAS domain S-box-containing protein